MTDQSINKNGSPSAEALLMQDMEPYEANENDFISSLFANNGGAIMSFFAFPIIGILALFGRKRNFLMFNLTQAIVYQSIGIIISFALWIIWALIAGCILLIFRSGNAHAGSDQLFWPILVLGAIPALFSVGWITYAILYVADLKRLDEKMNGYFVYPKITVWLDRKFEDRKIRSLRKKDDRLGEAAFMMVQGNHNMVQKKYEKALEYFHTAVQIYRSMDDKERVTQGLSTLLLAQSVAEKPIAMFETTYLLARMHYETGAKESYREAIDLIVEITCEEKNNQELIKQLNAMLREHPDDPILLFSRANLLENRQQFDQAYHDAVRAVEIQPEQPFFLFMLGIILEDQNCPEDAIEILSRAIVLDAEFTALYHHRATAYIEVNRLEDAITDTEQAVRLAPRAADTRAQQALLFLAKGEFAKAERYFRIAISKEDKVRWQLGLALAKLGIGDSESAHQTLTENKEKAQATDLDFARRWLNRMIEQSPLARKEIQTFQELLELA